jgi:S1-C subfamily serine protease
MILVPEATLAPAARGRERGEKRTWKSSAVRGPPSCSSRAWRFAEARSRSTSSRFRKEPGSGFVWDQDGHIVTNFHVTQQGDAFSVTLADQSEWEAKVAGAAPDKDVAVLPDQGAAREAAAARAR